MRRKIMSETQNILQDNSTNSSQPGTFNGRPQKLDKGRSTEDSELQDPTPR